MTSNELNITSSLEALQTDEQRHVPDIIARLRKCGLDSVLSLPQLVGTYSKAATPPRQHSSTPRITPPSTMQPEMDEARPQAEHGHQPTPVDDEHHHTPRTSRSPSAAVESVAMAEYQEWLFQGFLKRTKIGNETTYNLEFKLPRISEHLNLPIDPEALDMSTNSERSAEAGIPHEAVAHSKTYPVAVRPQIKRVRWAPEEDATILKMREEDGCSWEEIHAALPHRNIGTIQVRFSTKLKR